MSRIAKARKLHKAIEARGNECPFYLAYRIVRACEDTRTPVPRLAALVEKESGFKMIFGHDAGGLFPGERVTRRKYRALQNSLRAGAGGANGVGLIQATYPPFIEEDDDLWREKHNLRWGAELLDSLIRSSGREQGMNNFNGDPTGAYGRDLSLRVTQYTAALRKET